MTRRLLSGLGGPSGRTALASVGAVLAVVTMVGIGADAAVMYFNRHSMQMAADAATLAGANDLARDSNAALQTTLEYAQLGGLKPTEVSGLAIDTPTDGSAPTVTIKASRAVPYVFGRAFGLNPKIIQVSAKAWGLGVSGSLGCRRTADPSSTSGSGRLVGDYEVVRAGLQYHKWHSGGAVSRVRDNARIDAYVVERGASPLQTAPSKDVKGRLALLFVSVVILLAFSHNLLYSIIVAGSPRREGVVGIPERALLTWLKRAARAHGGPLGGGE